MQIRPVSMDAGLQGIQRANAGIHSAAAEIVGHGSQIHQRGVTDLAAPLVALKTNTLLFEASGQVIRVGDDNTGRLIDVLV